MVFCGTHFGRLTSYHPMFTPGAVRRRTRQLLFVLVQPLQGQALSVGESERTAEKMTIAHAVETTFALAADVFWVLDGVDSSVTPAFRKALHVVLREIVAEI
eukprot:GFKZ01012798.1.p2 GENE.GFKZ01012798.1~~GFKZ01012798.1.p2  ORF type:complete len:102 (-),score=7.54 GFKZ01012798.1:272-577(-)